MSSMQLSCWIAYVSPIGVPTSATICGRSSSLCLSSASFSCSRQRLAERLVGRPRRLVERAAGRGDRPLHVGDDAVGDRADDRLGRGVDVVVGRAARGLDELRRRSTSATRRSSSSCLPAPLVALAAGYRGPDTGVRTARGMSTLAAACASPRSTSDRTPSICSSPTCTPTARSTPVAREKEMLRLGDDVARDGRISGRDRRSGRRERPPAPPARRRARAPGGHRQGDERDPHRGQRQRARRPHRGRDRRRGRGDQRDRGSPPDLRRGAGQRGARTGARAVHRHRRRQRRDHDRRRRRACAGRRACRSASAGSPPSSCTTTRRRAPTGPRSTTASATELGAGRRTRCAAAGRRWRSARAARSTTSCACAAATDDGDDPRERERRCGSTADQLRALHAASCACRPPERRRLPGLEEQARRAAPGRLDAARHDLRAVRPRRRWSPATGRCARASCSTRCAVTIPTTGRTIRARCAAPRSPASPGGATPTSSTRGTSRALALSLFDQTQALHELGDRDREMLEYAALLHDIGQHVSRKGHHRHAAYLVENGELRGLRARRGRVPRRARAPPPPGRHQVVGAPGRGARQAAHGSGSASWRPCSGSPTGSIAGAAAGLSDLDVVGRVPTSWSCGCPPATTPSWSSGVPAGAVTCSRRSSTASSRRPSCAARQNGRRRSTSDAPRIGGSRPGTSAQIRRKRLPRAPPVG